MRTAPDLLLSTRYIESSALVAALLERDSAARASIRAQGKRVTSALTVAEASRAILRGRATGRLTEADERAAIRGLQVFARRCDLVGVTDAVLARVGRPFPVEPIRTLDAVHLATAEELAEPPALVTIVTRDARVRDLASAPAERERIANALAQLPLAFEPNRGQAAAGVKFLTRAPGYLSQHAPRPQVNAGRPPRLARN